MTSIETRQIKGVPEDVAALIQTVFTDGNDANKHIAEMIDKSRATHTLYTSKKGLCGAHYVDRVIVDCVITSVERVGIILPFSESGKLQGQAELRYINYFDRKNCLLYSIDCDTATTTQSSDLSVFTSAFQVYFAY